MKACAAFAVIVALVAGAPDPSILHDDDVCMREGSSCSMNALQTSKQKRQDEVQGIKIIGAGHPRTGSQSAKLALTHLGYKAAHGEDFKLSGEVRELWMDYVSKPGPKTASEFEPLAQNMLLDGINATTSDWPASAAYKELSERFPSAKVILFTHPKGSQGWVDSFQKAALYHTCGGGLRTVLFDQWVTFGKSVMHGDLKEFEGETVELPFTQDLREKLARAYEEDNEQVRRTVPKERLLDYDVSQGWGPLCEFLGVPVPDVPFPHFDDLAHGNRCNRLFGRAADVMDGTTKLT